MTTSRTRRPTKKETEAKAPQPMDPDASETPVPVNADGVQDPSRHAPYSARNCWALEVLVEEVVALYPEVDVTTTDVTSRKVGIEVTFGGWDADHEENEPLLPAVLACVEGDSRVAEVTETGTQGVSVRMHANPVTMDQRDPFGIRDAYTIMLDGE